MVEKTMDWTQPSATNADATTDLLSLTQAARVIGVSRDIIRSWIVRGDLPALRIGHRRYIAPTDLGAVYARLTLGGWCCAGGRIVGGVGSASGSSGRRQV
jgi:excisionase family DNA binding protein